MTAERLLHLHVAVQRDSNPIRGTLSDSHEVIAFDGWLELMSAFDTARERPAGAAEACERQPDAPPTRRPSRCFGNR